MDILTLTSEIKNLLGFDSAFITVDNKDLMIQIKQLNSKLIIFTCPFYDFKYGQTIKITIKTENDNFSFDCEMDNFYESEIILVCECKTKEEIKNEFFIALEKILDDFKTQTKRKEMRILCNKRNLEILHLNNILLFDFHYKSYRGVIKDISLSGLKVLTKTELLNENGELFNFKLFFSHPEEKFIFNSSYIVRKRLFSFENHDFAEIVFKLPENVRFIKRLSSFLEENQNRITLSR